MERLTDMDNHVLWMYVCSTQSMFRSLCFIRVKCAKNRPQPLYAEFFCELMFCTSSHKIDGKNLSRNFSLGTEPTRLRIHATYYTMYYIPYSYMSSGFDDDSSSISTVDNCILWTFCGDVIIISHSCCACIERNDTHTNRVFFLWFIATCSLRCPVVAHECKIPKMHATARGRVSLSFGEPVRAFALHGAPCSPSAVVIRSDSYTRVRATQTD